MNSWSKFTFFDQSEQRNPIVELPLVGIVSGKNYVIAASEQGIIYFMTPQLELASSIQAGFDGGCSHISAIERYCFVVVLGISESKPTLKFWCYDRLDLGIHPICTRTIQLTDTPTCAIAHSSFKYLAIGTVTGQLHIYENDVAHGRKSVNNILFKRGTPITNLSFDATGKDVLLYCSTINEITIVNMTRKREQIQLDKRGVASRCMYLSEALLYVARPDMLSVYSFTPSLVKKERELSSSLAGLMPNAAATPAPVALQPPIEYKLPGTPLILECHGDHIYIVQQSANQATQVNCLIYDMVGRCEAFRGTYPTGVAFLVPAWQNMWLFNSNGRLARLSERPLNAKLDEIFRKSQFQVAVQMAKNKQLSVDITAQIYRRYGDYLYNQQDYEGAIDKYIMTIGSLEPTDVIRRFLDGSKVTGLMRYLEELHKSKGRATPDHSTLLINCYARLKMVDKLDKFTETCKACAETGAACHHMEFEFDVAAAVRVLRSAGYHSHAALLCEQHKLVDQQIRILIEDKRDYSRALHVMELLDWKDVSILLKRYSADLLTALTGVLELVRHHLQRSPEQVLADCPSLLSGHESSFACLLLPLLTEPPPPTADLHWTLIETCLRVLPYSEKRQQLETKLLPLLDNVNEKKLNQAVVLCQQTEFKAALSILYAKSTRYRPLLLETADPPILLKLASDPKLAITALRTLAIAQPSSIPAALKIIPKDICVLQVLDALAVNADLPVSACQEFLLTRFNAEKCTLEAARSKAQQFETLAYDLEQRLGNADSAVVEFHGSACDWCKNELRTPSVHFLCKHSFHQTCFQAHSRHEDSCPLCESDLAALSESLKRKPQSDVSFQQAYMENVDDDVMTSVSKFIELNGLDDL